MFKIMKFLYHKIIFRKNKPSYIIIWGSMSNVCKFCSDRVSNIYLLFIQKKYGARSLKMIVTLLYFCELYVLHYNYVCPYFLLMNIPNIISTGSTI